VVAAAGEAADVEPAEREAPAFPWPWPFPFEPLTDGVRRLDELPFIDMKTSATRALECGTKDLA
jgi:hypothetical protein